LKHLSIETVSEHINSIHLANVLRNGNSTPLRCLNITQIGDLLFYAKHCLKIVFFEIAKEFLARNVVFLPLEHLEDEGLCLVCLAVDNLHEFLQLSEGGGTMEE
jgi:hypothetical protein